MNNLEEHTRIILRADGGDKTGLGHIYRIIAISQCIPKGIKFLLLTNYNRIHEIIPKEFPTQIIDYNKDDISYYRSFSKLKLIVCDGYSFDADYQRRIKENGYNLIYIDDLAKEYMYANTVINHSPGFEEGDFIGEPYTHYFLGPKYSIIRKEFLQPVNTGNTSRNKVIISMGGSDKNNLTLKVLEVIDKIPKITTVYIVLGDSYKYLSSLNKFKNPKYQIFQNINAEKMSYLMKSSDIGITSASTVLYEMLMLRMKVFCGYYVDNQKRVYDEFLRKKLILPLGNLLGDFESNLFDGLINFNNLELIISDYFDQQNQKRIKQIILKLL